MDPSALCDLKEFKKKTGDLLRQLAGAKKQPGTDHIYVAGEKEYNAEKDRKKTGVPMTRVTQRQFLIMQKELELTQYKFNFDVDINEADETGW